MSRSVMKPLSTGASLPESLSLLDRRLLVAEGQGEELAKKLGVSGDELGTEVMDGSQPEALVARVFHLESLLHTLRLSVFRIETARELTSLQTAHLQEQCEEEQRSWQREAKRLRDRLQQERDKAQREMHTLREQLHASYRSQTDVAAAADELKKVKVQLSRKLHQMKEAVVQETAARLEAEQSHDALLQRVKVMEGEVENANERVRLLQTDCHALDVDGQEARAELEEKAELIESLQEVCQQLRRQLEEKDTLASDLCAELTRVKITLQKQQQDNSTLLKSKEKVTAARDKVQAQNDHLAAQCSDLSSALRSLTQEKTQLQARLKMQQERTAHLLKDMDLQLHTARRNMQCEVQEALTERRWLNKELENRRADHTNLKQSSAAALDAAVNHQELLDRTITRLRGELSNAIKDGETMQQEKEEVFGELKCVRTNYKNLQEQLKQVCGELKCVRTNYKNLQEQLKQVQEELQMKECQMSVWRSELENVQRENLRLKDQQHNTHTKNTETLQTELGEKLDELRRQGRQREAELHKAKQEINQLTKQVDELRRAKHHGKKSAQKEMCELKNALGDVSSRSHDLSRTNRELRGKSLEQLRDDVACLQAELLALSSGQQEELQAEQRFTHTLQQKCQLLEECVVKMNEERDKAERKMKEVRIESQQISENLQEAHSWFRTKFHSLNIGLERSRAPLQEEPGYEIKTPSDRGEVVCVAELELERWASTLQRWEMKKELDGMDNLDTL